MFALVVVDYRSASKTIKYIKHICDKIDEEICVVTVDNSNNRENYDLLVEEFNAYLAKYNCKFHYSVGEYDKNKIYIIKSKENLGYAKGNNLGLDFIGEIVYPTPDYVIISNNDLKVLNAHLNLDLFRKVFMQNEDVAIVGPQIIGLDNMRQSPCKKIGLTKRWIIPNLLYPFYKIFRSDLWTDVIEDINEGYVYRVQGSFMVCDFNSLNIVNGFDEKTFLYCEENILSEKLEKINKKVFFIDYIKILHEHDQTIGSYYNYTEKIKIRFSSEIYYYKKYLNVNAVTIKFAELLFKWYLHKYKVISTLKTCKTSFKKKSETW